MQYKDFSYAIIVGQSNKIITINNIYSLIINKKIEEKINSYESCLDLMNAQLEDFLPIIPFEWIHNTIINYPTYIPKINKKRKINEIYEKKCTYCNKKETPQWRISSRTQVLLCNACGLMENKKLKLNPINKIV